MRRFGSVVLAGLVVLSACGGDDRGGQATEREEREVDASTVSLEVAGEVTDAPPANELEALVAQVGPDGRLPAEVALQLFALQLGPLPGVEVPDGDPGPAQSSTLAVRSVLARWGELDADVQVAVREHLGMEPDWNPSVTAKGNRGGGRSAATARAGAAQSTSGHRSDASTPRVPGDRGNVAGYRAAVDRLLPVLERHLGPLGPTVVIQEAATGRSDIERRTLAHTLVDPPSTCTITVFPQVFPPPSGPTVALAHELFHCYQQSWNANTVAPAWVEEGTAQWVGAVANAEAGGPDDLFVKLWMKRYYLTPQTSLFRRSYDGIGWFTHLAEVTGPLWDRLRGIVTAIYDDAAYGAAVGGAGTSIGGSWATSQSARSSWGADWVVEGPGVEPMDNDLAPSYPPLGNGSNLPVTSPAYATGQASARLEAQLTKFNVVPPTLGTARLGDRDVPIAELSGTTWCTDPNGDCTCPPGTARAGQSFPRLDGSELFVAVGAGSAAGSLTVQGTSLEDECGADADCPVGKWVQNTPATGIPGASIESGGTGTVLTVQADGALTQDFGSFVPQWATSSYSPDMRVYYAPSGFISAKVPLVPGGARTELPLADVDVSRLGGTGRAEVDGQVVEMGDLGTLAAGIGFEPGTTLSCVGEDQVEIRSGTIVHTYDRAP